MLLRCGGSRNVCFVSSLSLCALRCVAILADLCQLARSVTGRRCRRRRMATGLGGAGLTPDCCRAHLGAGFAHSLAAATGDRLHSLASKQVRLDVFRVRPRGPGRRRRWATTRRHPCIAGRRGVEPSLLNSSWEKVANCGPSRSPRDTVSTTGLDHRDGLGCGQVAAPATRQQPQRLGHRLDGARSGTRATMTRSPWPEGTDGLFEVKDAGLVDAVSHIIGTDQDECHVRVVDLFQRCGSCGVQARGLRPADRHVGQLDRAAAQR